MAQLEYLVVTRLNNDVPVSEAQLHSAFGWVWHARQNSNGLSHLYAVILALEVMIVMAAPFWRTPSKASGWREPDPRAVGPFSSASITAPAPG